MAQEGVLVFHFLFRSVGVLMLLNSVRSVLGKYRSLSSFLLRKCCHFLSVGRTLNFTPLLLHSFCPSLPVNFLVNPLTSA